MEGRNDISPEGVGKIVETVKTHEKLDGYDKKKKTEEGLY